MGSNVSVEGCDARYGIKIDCTPPERGNVGGEYFEYNPDIAGLGVSCLNVLSSWLQAQFADTHRSWGHSSPSLSSP